MTASNEFYERAAETFQAAQAFVIGASNGLSISEGFNIFADDEWFRDHFGDFRERHGLRSVMQAASYPYATDEERWGFWSRLAFLKSYDEPATSAMLALRSIVDKRPCFIVTTNGEGHFQQAGFSESSVFEMEWSLRKMRCSSGCSPDLVCSENSVRAMVAAESNGRVPEEYHPRCQYCGGPMQINAGQDSSFFSSSTWQEKYSRYRDFLTRHSFDNVAVVALGLGTKNSLVSAALELALQVVSSAHVVSINIGEFESTARSNGLIIKDDLTHALNEIAGRVSEYDGLCAEKPSRK